MTGASGDRHARETPERLYVITGGRSQPPGGRSFELFTMVVAQDQGPPPAATGAEHARILRLCRQPQSVLELSGHLGLPVGVIKILLDDLLTCGHISVRAPHTPPAAERPDVKILEAVLSGLSNLR